MGLNPFFSYFGSKYRLARLYSPPKYNVIVEPFAGSAGYSLLYPDRKVYLYDIYEPIVEVWEYLINVTEREILSLPIGPFSKENPIDSYNICSSAQKLIGFWATESQTYSSRYPQSKARGGNWSERKKKLIASQLQYIRHWKIECKSYENIQNQPATWFVDPPYLEAGKRYRNNKIDYDLLAEWCKQREGQVIACEQGTASWLDFKSLRDVRNGSNNKYKEIYWEKI